MASERTWNAVPPVLLTADGTTTGLLQVVDTAGFFYGAQATLKNNSTQLTVYIGLVVDSTHLWVRAEKNSKDYNVDLSAFTVASGSHLSAAVQNKSSVPMEARLLATYATDPIDAWRTQAIDQYGNPYNDSNPLPVAFDGTVTIGDVSIVEGGNTMTVNADGSINVIVEAVPSPNSSVISTYNEVLAVASNATTQIVSYTVPPAMRAILQRAPFSGENIGKYDLLINTVKQDTARTMFGGDLTGTFNFISGNDSGLLLNAGDIISVQVMNPRPSSANYEARIQVLQFPA